MSETLSYDMVKSLKASGVKISVAQCDAAIAHTEERLNALTNDLAVASAVYVESRIKGFQALKAVLGPHAATIAKDAIETGKSSGKAHATTKSPFPEDEEVNKSLADKAKAVGRAFKVIEHGVCDEEHETAAKGLAEVQAKIGDEIRHLSKLVSWRERIAMGLAD